MRWGKGNKWGKGAQWGSGSIDYEDAATGRLLEQFKGSPNLNEIVAIFARRMDHAAYIFRAIEAAFILDSAEGSQLDVLGRILDHARGTDTDDRYRLKLKAKAFLIIPGGRNRLPRMFEIISTLIGGTERIVGYSENYPCGYQIILLDLTATEEQDLQDFLPFTRPITYNGWLIFTETEGLVFDDNDGVYTVSGLGYGDQLDGATGGEYADAVELS